MKMSLYTVVGWTAAGDVAMKTCCGIVIRKVFPMDDDSSPRMCTRHAKLSEHHPEISRYTEASFPLQAEHEDGHIINECCIGLRKVEQRLAEGRGWILMVR